MRGFEILARNWRGKRGEIDVVARKGRLIVVCEVKARTSQSHGTALEAVGPTKQARVRRTALDWMETVDIPGTLRFDVAAVTPGGLEVIEGAF